MTDIDFFICPKCHIGYSTTKKEFNDHCKSCDGRKDIICTRFYTYDELNICKEKKNTKHCDICDIYYLMTNREFDHHKKVCKEKIKVISPYFYEL
jgi:hypothetical protein